MKQNGFTLIEMLVALFIFGLLTAGGVTMMRFALSNEAVVRAHDTRLAQFQAARAILKADLAQAAPRRVRGADGRAEAGAMGPAEGALLSLARRGWENPDAAPRASVQFVEYRLVEGRLERLAGAALDGGAFRPPQVLIDGVSSARTQYLAHGAWSPDPPAAGDDLPQAVRLDLTIAGLGVVSQLFLVTGEPS